MRKVRFIWMLLLMTGVCPSCSDGGGEGEETSAVDFTVDFNSVITDNFVGFGTQYNNYLYTTRTYNTDGVSAANLPDLEKKVKDLKSQYVRIFFDRKCWPGYSGSNAEFMPSTIKVLELAQASGSKVNLTYWHTSAEAQMPAFAEFIKEMFDRGLTCITQVTIQNEVNAASEGITQPEYNIIYRAFDKRLKELGIRDRIDIVGGDLLFYDNQPLWFAYMGEHMADILDGYSAHIYWFYPAEPTKATDRLRNVKNSIDAMPAASRRPKYITEFGVRGVWIDGDPYRPGYYHGAPIGPTTVYATEHARFNIEALNYGMNGVIKWDCYKAMYDNTPQHNYLIGSGTDGYPLYPAYHMFRLFTHSMASGWQTVKTTVKKADEFKLVAAMKSATGGNMTVFAMNNSNGELFIGIDGLPANKTFHTLIWNKTQAGDLVRGDDVTADAKGNVTLPMTARSVVALTTLDPTL